MIAHGQSSVSSGRYTESSTYYTEGFSAVADPIATDNVQMKRSNRDFGGVGSFELHLLFQQLEWRETRNGIAHNFYRQYAVSSTLAKFLLLVILGEVGGGLSQNYLSFIISFSVFSRYFTIDRFPIIQIPTNFQSCLTFGSNLGLPKALRSTKPYRIHQKKGHPILTRQYLQMLPSWRKRYRIYDSEIHTIVVILELFS